MTIGVCACSRQVLAASWVLGGGVIIFYFPIITSTRRALYRRFPAVVMKTLNISVACSKQLQSIRRDVILILCFAWHRCVLRSVCYEPVA